ncbi:MAG TPA: sugar phosphate nucleotidyltransferase [Steroidobacteraceae bacterium]|nr:sugar phosphate nucleotidyltransferase [Steroidobacteraceae bacterium]
MKHRDNYWALVLAAGDGRRLSELTTGSAGVPIPKQFCSLRGGPSLLQEAMRRAQAVAGRDQIAAVVAAGHRQWWREQLAALKPENMIVQPRNCGTAVGVLLPLLHILERDPDARLVLLPSDHYVRDEVALAEALRRAMNRGWSAGASILLLGLAPREADSELGYIVPGSATGTHHFAVERFVEKPAARVAERLIEQGALWNAFIIVADARALLKLFERCCPEVVLAMREALARPDPEARAQALEQLYSRLPELDFSRHILQEQEQHLCVMPVADCGWSDLGTPQRVADVLENVAWARPSDFPGSELPVLLSLADAHGRVGRSSRPRRAAAPMDRCAAG